MKIERIAPSVNAHALDDEQTVPLVQRTRDASGAHGPAYRTDRESAVSADPAAAKPATTMMFKLDLSYGMALKVGDDEDDDYKYPNDMPFYADIPITFAEKLPAPAEPPQAATYAFAGDAAGNGAARHLETAHPVPQTSPAATQQDSDRTAHAASSRTRVAVHRAPALPRALKPASPASSTEPPVAPDLYNLASHIDASRASLHRDTRQASNRDPSAQETTDTHVAVARMAAPLPGQTPLPEDAPMSDPASQQPARPAPGRLSPPVQSPAQVTDAGSKDVYEVTYRFTSWGTEASVKLKMDMSQAGTITARPSNARVHRLLNADLNKVAMPDGKPDLPRLDQAAPLVTLVDPDEHEQRRQQPPSYVPPPEEEA